MSQLYYLKNGSIGHYCDVYKEHAVGKMARMPKHKLAGYISEMAGKPSQFGNDAERLRKALKVIKSSRSSVSELNKSLEVVAEVEYYRVFSLNCDVYEAANKLIRKYRKNQEF